MISSNHNVYNLKERTKKSLVVIGNYSWIGMNSVILPGVKLGNHTIVAAGSIVTKSFPQGHCVIGGNPAKLIKKLDPEKIVPFKDDHEFHGYIPKRKFEAYKNKYLKSFLKDEKK